MFQRAIDAGRNLSVLRRPAYMRQCTGDSRTEMHQLTAASTKSDVGTDTAYRPHEQLSDAPQFVRVKKTLAQRIFGDRFAGWRFGALHFAIWATIVLCINVAVTVWNSTQAKSGVLFEGDCNRVKRLNTGLHFLINVLSTILLSGSNYCMQCLSAPTRSEVDKAHGKGTWLDIGIPSIRNVKHLSRKRTTLWVLLTISSLPLHLFYNSAVFGSLSSNDYMVFAISEPWLTEFRNYTQPVDPGPAYRLIRHNQQAQGWGSENVDKIHTVLNDLHQQHKKGELQRLEPAQCLQEYATAIQPTRRHLLLIADESKFPPQDQNIFINGSRVYWGFPFYSTAAMTTDDAASAYDWICSSLPDNGGAEGVCSEEIDGIRSNSNAWTVGPSCNTAYVDNCPPSYPVDYCLSQQALPHCQLQFDLSIAIVVIMLNFIKAAIMFFVAYCVPEDPLITMGDAVASFLEREDPSTKDMCLLSIHDVRSNGYKAGTRAWEDRRFKWKDVITRRRRNTILAIFSATLIIVISLFIYGLNSMPIGASRSLSTLARLGYGTVDPRTAMTGLPNNMALNAIVANTPQVILSVLYFSYNALFTTFLLAYEWLSYASKRKGLRVSRQPIGAQRAEYFLQLPYRFGVPLMLLNGVLHWLVSQAIFLVSIDFYGYDGTPGGYQISPRSATVFDFKTCGFSPIAIFSVIILGGLMIVGVVAFGYVPYSGGMILAGNCSMAISAACHLDKEADVNGEVAAVEKLQWGVVSVGDDGVGHCAFSTKDVGVPVKGEVYAGNKDGRLEGNQQRS